LAFVNFSLMATGRMEGMAVDELVEDAAEVSSWSRKQNA
jgi:hypothetical protein